MKTNKIIMSAMLLMSTLMVNAQREVRSFTIQPKVGMTISTMTNNPQMEAIVTMYNRIPSGEFDYGEGQEKKGISYTGIKEKIGLVAGAEIAYQMSRRLGLSAGLLYSMQGARYNDFHNTNIEVTNAKVSLEYINVPIMANYYVVKGLALKAGIQPAFCVKDKTTGDITIHTEEHWDTYVKTVKMPDFHKFELSVPVGISYEYQDFVIGAMYNIGLTNIFGDSWDKSSHSSAHNSVLQITLGYQISL